MAKKTQPQQSPQQQTDTQNPFDAAAKQLAVAWTQKLTTANAALTSGMQPLLGLSQRFNDANAALADKLKKQDGAARTLAISYGVATAAIGGWVRAGLAGTTLGERLAFTHKQLAMQFASVFVPWIEKGTDALQHLAEKFRALTGEQQQQIAQWAGISTGLLGALTLVPKLATAFRLLGTSLATTVMANPVLAIAAGVVALLASTDKGRSALVHLGQSLLKAFEPIAKMLADVLVPAIKHLADLLASDLFVRFSTAGLQVLGALAEKIRSLREEFRGFKTVLDSTFAGPLAIMNELGKRFERKNPFEDVAEKVRAGEMTKKEAEEEISRRAQKQAEQEEGERGGQRLDFFGRRMPRESREDFIKRRREELERRGKEGLGDIKGRSDLTLARTGTEDARATIRRLEDSVLKVDTGKETAKNTGDAAKTLGDILKMIQDAIRQKFGKQDNRPDDPKAD